MGHLRCFLVLFIAGIGAEDIPTVQLNNLITFDGPGFTVEWEPIDRNHTSDPVIGVKVKAWLAPCVTDTVYKYVDGVLVKLYKTERKKIDVDEIPHQNADFICIASADASNCTVPKIKIDIWYHVRALAFTKTAEGPLSGPYNFKIHPDNESERDKTCI